ncbi:hypothetical protein HDV05_005119 [Chytridiales sp. JEL 0842]|nr:hypothetical protein HDV05_005119 [Chytridiales sp. JEL 0842]
MTRESSTLQSPPAPLPSIPSTSNPSQPSASQILETVPVSTKSNLATRSGSGKAVSDDPSHVVVDSDAVKNKDGETFLTQRAGKILQNGFYVPLVQGEQTPSMFENRRTLQSTLLLQKKKEMHAIQAALEKKRLEFAKRMEECREKQEELRAKQKQIRDRVTKFEKFLKENDAKRQRANLKALTEKKLREQKEQELQTLQHTLAEEQVKSDHILKLIKKYQVFEAYLQSVVDILPPDYLDINEPHINDILMRYKTLVETNEDLKKMVQANQDGIEKEQSVLASLIKDKNDMILVYNSKLGTQQKRLDKLKQESAYMEQKIEERDRTGKERLRILSETKLAINNIFDRVANRAEAPGGGFVLKQTGPTGITITLQGASGPPNYGTSSGTNGGTAGAAEGGAFMGPGGIQRFSTAAGSGGQPSVVVGNSGWGGGAPKESDNSAKALAEKLHAIQERVLDLQAIAMRAEQAIQQERIERQRKHMALVAELATAGKQ